MRTSWDQRPCIVSSLDDEVDLNASPERQRGHRDRRTGGKGLAEMLGVNAIHRRVITDARKIHTSARDIIETLAGRLENRREILENALRLGRNTSRHQLARRRVLTDLAAEKDETIDFDRLGKRADRRREFGRGNCDLAHGKLLWMLGQMVGSISAIMSISTQAPNGTCATLTALRECMPRSPNTWTSSSDAPSATR